MSISGLAGALSGGNAFGAVGGAVNFQNQLEHNARMVAAREFMYQLRSDNMINRLDVNKSVAKDTLSLSQVAQA